MRHHRLRPHAADTRLQITADSLAELFEGAVDGLSEIMKHGATRKKGDPSIIAEVDISSRDVNALLVDFLNDLLAKNIIENAIYFDIIELELEGNRAIAKVCGIKVDSFDEDVKAVTHHGAQIQFHIDGTYEVELVLDI